jgi:DNA repair exonuclease SbcCD ATPase subunit
MARKAEANARWQNAETRLKHVEAEIAGVSGDIMSQSEDQEFLEPKLERTHSLRLRQELTELIAEQWIVEKALAAIVRLKDKCPTCGQPISSGDKAREIEKQSDRLAEIKELVH